MDTWHERRKRLTLGVVLVTLIALCFWQVSAEELSPSITTDKAEYALGEEVLISAQLGANETCSLLVITPSGEGLTLLENESQQFGARYTPNEEGNYTVKCESLPAGASFIVIAPVEAVEPQLNETEPALNETPVNETAPTNETSPGNETEVPTNQTELPANETESPANQTEEIVNETEEPSLASKKPVYWLGEEVIILVKLSDNVSCDLVIVTPSGEALTQVSNESGSFSDRYTPNEIGLYAVTCNSSVIRLEANFTVTEAEEAPEELIVEIPEEPVPVGGENLTNETPQQPPIDIKQRIEECNKIDAEECLKSHEGTLMQRMAECTRIRMRCIEEAIPKET